MVINELHNPFGFKEEELFAIGKRANNLKRSFLFVSKLLGKHIPVKPDVCKAAGHLLASLRYPSLGKVELIQYLQDRYDEEKSGEFKKVLDRTINPHDRVLVIGFAETATGLGMSVASAIEGCTYYSTTREDFKDKNFLFSFEEEHSHATTHKCYDMLGTQFKDFDEIILVDDEITTGNSMLNLIHELIKVTHVKNYSVLSILDWRNSEQINKYHVAKEEWGVNISVYSVLSGKITGVDETVYTDNSEVLELNILPDKLTGKGAISRVNCILPNGDYIQSYEHSGRFGVSQENIALLESKAVETAFLLNHSLLKDGGYRKILVLSEGEDIYIPSRIAAWLDCDYDVEFRTTTRSPIYVDGEIINEKHYYYGHNGVKYFMYNKTELEIKYDLVLFLGEFPAEAQLTGNMLCVDLK